MLNLLIHRAAEQEVRKLKDHPGGSKTERASGRFRNRKSIREVQKQKEHPGGSKTERASGKFRNSKIIREAQKTGRAFRKYRI